MPFLHNCPRCSFEYNLPDDAWGKNLRCRECKATFRVTDPSEEEFADLLPPKSSDTSEKSTSSTRTSTRSNKRKRSGSKFANFPTQTVLAGVGGLAGLGLVVWLFMTYVIPLFQATPLSLARESLSIGKELARILESVVDRETALEAAEEIRELAQDEADLRRRAADLKMKRPLTDAEIKELEEVRQESDNVRSQIESSARRIAGIPEAKDVIMSAILEFQSAASRARSF